MPAGYTDPDPSDNQPWEDGPLSLPDRKKAKDKDGKAYVVPTVSAIAIGQDADLAELQVLADVGGGTLTYVNGPVSSQQFMSTTIELADAFRQSANTASGHQRVRSTRALSVAPADMPAVTVEPRVSELLVSVLSSQETLHELELVTPDGVGLPATERKDMGAVWRVASPASGEWTWRLSGTTVPPPSTEPTVFVEQAVRSPVMLFAEADVAGIAKADPALGGNYDSARWVGKPVFIRAIPTDGGIILGASITADVQPPAGPATTHTLLDDGLHGDGAANDGLYGTVYRGRSPAASVSRAGLYAVRIVAMGQSSATGGAFRREKNLAFELHDGKDADGDGLPDWWEEAYGTNKNLADASADPDSDGLVNANELSLGTLPLDSDTDGGGEADGSELLAGRDPLMRGDDAASIQWPWLQPGNAKTMLAIAPPIAVTDVVVQLQVEKGPALQGPFMQAFSGPVPAGGVLAVEAPNDQTTCYRVRTVAGATTSAWSPVQCVVPRVDPFPPALSLGPTWGSLTTRTREVKIRIAASDVETASHTRITGEGTGTVSTGVKEMIVSPQADFLGATWQSYAAETALWLDDAAETTYWVKVRDGAGNESAPRSITVRLGESTPVDRAIRFEERALDRLKEAKWAEARSAIAQSLPEIDKSIRKVLERISGCKGKPDASDVKLLVKLAQIRGLKTEAWALSKAPTRALSEKALKEALERERSVADEATRRGIGL
jgi:hypothetical protein